MGLRKRIHTEISCWQQQAQHRTAERKVGNAAKSAMLSASSGAQVHAEQVVRRSNHQQQSRRDHTRFPIRAFKYNATQ
jgi:hypothetical protein